MNLGVVEQQTGRPHISGKFISRGADKLYLRGVTYGTFRPDACGVEYSRSTVRSDFAAMAAAGINALRLYTVPPRWLLDCASEDGLAVLVGLPWEQHVAFADDRARCGSIVARVRDGVRTCAGHPAVLGYAVGNEIPAQIVRWHGRRKVERFIRRLYDTAKSEDPDGLITYVNFPSTEYLDLSFLDFECFNVYLEQRDRLEAYLYRLQNLAGDRPLVLAELGLDSRRNGDQRQAQSLAWQIRAAFAGGCAGLFTFAWTDEWWRGGETIEDWDFGLTTRGRKPKPALAAVSEAYDQVPLPTPPSCPRVSVVVCTYNGEATLGDCLDGLAKLTYPDYEVIVVDDGSTDSSAEVAARHDVRLVRTENRGLASARNAGMKTASGEIIAYVDDDARPDPHWLHYLVAEFARGDHCAVGGPNIAPGGDGLTADCVASAPGGPLHVLLSDAEAEHIPGCNMAIRAQALRAIGGFDPRFAAAGDDVDVCWRLAQRGWTIGFAPAGFVWHHRRNSVRAYWRQQRGYGKAEALLERKWPERYNCAGHLHWSGRMYGRGLQLPLLSGRKRVYHGTWGLGPFQSVYEPAQGTLLSMPLMPEWYLLIAALAVLSGLGALWRPVLVVLPLLALCLLMAIAGAARGAARETLSARRRLSRKRKTALVALTTALHLLQPVARLTGRLAHGLSPWRLRARRSVALPVARTLTAWSETWRSPDERLRAIETALRENDAAVLRGGEFDRWDLEVRYGTMGRARARMTIEEHGQGKQLVRLRCWPRASPLAIAATGSPAALALLCSLDGTMWIAGVLGGLCLLAAMRVIFECGATAGALARAFRSTSQPAYAAETGARPRRMLHRYAVMLRYVRRQTRGWLAMLALTLLLSGVSLLIPLPLKVLIDNVIGHHAPPAYVTVLPRADSRSVLLIYVVAAELAFFALASTLDVALTFLWIKVGQKMVYDLARDLFARVARGSMRDHARRPFGETVQRVAEHSWAVHTVADELLFTPLSAAATAIGLVVIMVAINPGLAALACAVAPVMTIASVVLGKPARNAGNRQRELQGQLQSHVQQTLAGMGVVQAFAAEERQGKRFSELTRAALGSQVSVAVIGGLNGLWTGIIAAVGAGAILLVGAHEVLAGGLTVGGLVIFVVYAGRLQLQLASFADIYTTLQTTRASIDRVVEVFDEPVEVGDARGAVGLSRVAGDVVFDRVSFGYESGRRVLREVSFHARPGEVLAIVGATGAGKSTLAALLPRFFDPEHGRVLLDGHDLREIKLADLRANVALVLQESFLFPFTIAENIAFGRPGASQQQIQAAAEAAGAHHFITRLPEGYNTVLGERGATLSGGERQRIAIARALLKDAPVLILDEPTSALDTATEAHLLQALDRLMEGRTTLIIAHRLSTIKAANQIIVLDHGHPIETGTHQQLLHKNGHYADLHERQFGREAALA